MPTANEVQTIRQKLAVLRRSRRLLALFCLSAMISSLALTYIYSERYRAVTTIIYRPTDSIRFQNRQSQAMGFPVPLLPFEVLGQTIRQIGTSEALLRQVVEDLHLDRPVVTERTGLAGLFYKVKDAIKDGGKKTWQVLKYGRIIEENKTSAAILELAHNTTIEAERKDYTSRIEVVDKNPQRAAQVVDKLGRVLVEFMKRESVASARRQREELDHMLQARTAEIDAGRKELEKLRSDKHIISYPEEVSLNLQSADEFDRQLGTNAKEIAKARSRLEAIQKQRETLTPMIKSSESVEQDPLHDHLREMRAERNVRLEGLLKRYPADHADIQTLRAELKEIDASLSALQPKRVGKENTDINELHQKMMADEMQARAELAGLEAAGETLRQHVAELRGRFLGPDIETRLEDMKLKLSVLEGNYRQLATAREDSRIEELQSEGEIRVLHPATPQDAPFQPIKIYHVLASGILALILGVGLAYVGDFWQSVQRGDAEVEAVHV